MNKSYHIKIVDDSKLIIHRITKALKEKNYTVSHNTNGEEALKSIKKEKPDLILLDVEMPVMDGYKTIQHLKNNPDTSDIPVIFLTSVTKPEAIKKNFNLGAHDYIAKPFVDEELIARIELELSNLSLQYNLKDKMTRLADAISHDSLTKVYNHLYITALINRQMKKLENLGNGSFSLIYIDIDHFNSFNSMHGLNNSDKALHKFAAVIKNSIRENDTVSRWEGDRFLIYLPSIVKEKLLLIVKNILEKIEKTTFSSTTNLTASLTMMRIARIHKLDDVIKDLKTKMREAKVLGKSSVMLVEES